MLIARSAREGTGITKRVAGLASTQVLAVGALAAVTAGPYAVVRHPIYSGVLVAGVGTALALSWFWLVAVGLAGIYFIYSATVEERYLGEQFPDTYPAYKSSSKMLVPFVF